MLYNQRLPNGISLGTILYTFALITSIKSNKETASYNVAIRIFAEFVEADIAMIVGCRDNANVICCGFFREPVIE